LTSFSKVTLDPSSARTASTSPWRHLRPGHPGLAGEPVGDRADLPNQGALAGHPGALVATRNDLAADIGDRGPHPFAADVDADDPAGGRVQLVQHRARAAIAVRAANFAHQAGIQQSGQGERDGWLGESAHARNLGARQRPSVMNQFQDGALVDGPQQAGRSSRDRHGGPGAAVDRPGQQAA
jgi:hypothetical protein